jgi:hypothetical protein
MLNTLLFKNKNCKGKNIFIEKETTPNHHHTVKLNNTLIKYVLNMISNESEQIEILLRL